MIRKTAKNILKIIMISQIVFLSITAQAQERIKIDIISDVVCPWCAIGYKRLSQAISELGIEDKVDIAWHPFELNPNMPREGLNANKYLMNKLSLSEDGLVQKRASVTQLGEDTGFKFDYFKEMKKPNTLNAHILLDYAKDFNKQTKLKVRLQEAYFGERKDISNRDVLFKELKKVGLNAEEAIKTLDDVNAVKRVRIKEKFWRDRGVYAIPTMVFNNTIVRTGANNKETYKKLLSYLLLNKNP